MQTLAENLDPNQLIIPKRLKTLTYALLQEQKKPGLKKPIIKAEVYPGKPVWERLYHGNEPDGMPGIAFDGQGSLHRGRMEGTTPYRQKVTSPGPGSDFSLWTSLIATNGNFALAAIGAEISYFYVAPTGGGVRRYYSTNYGSSWTDVLLGNWNAHRIAADYKPDGTYGAAHSYMYSGYYIGLNGTYDSTQSFGECLGIALKYDGDWNIVFATTKDGFYRIYRLIRSDGFRVPAGTWGPYEILFEIPSTQGYILQFPFLAKSDRFLLSFVEKYTVTEAISRPYLSYGLKGHHFLETPWQEPLPFNYTGEYGLAIARYGDYIWATTPSGVWRAKLPSLSLSLPPSDIISLTEDITPNQGRLTIELDNSKGKYNSPPARGSEIRLNLGYRTRFSPSQPSQSETIETDHYWIERIEHRTAPNQRALVLTAISPWGLLKRWTPRHTLRWPANTTVYRILSAILGRISIPLEAISASTAILGFMPNFTISPGDNGLSAVNRLLNFTGDRLLFHKGKVYLVIPTPGDIPVYEYSKDSHPVIRGTYAVDTPEITRVQVIGRSGTTDIVVDGFNWEEISLVGDRLDFEPDWNITTVPQARERASAILRHQSKDHATIITPPNFAQQLYDIVQVTDLIAPITKAKYRLVASRLVYNAEQGNLEQQLSLGSP